MSSIDKIFHTGVVKTYIKPDGEMLALVTENRYF